MKLDHRLAAPEDMSYVKDLLKKNNLPVDDIDEKHLVLFIFFQDDITVGTGGLEGRGNKALIRSIAVEDQFKHYGFGKTIVEELCKFAKENDTNELYLLTETADKFFDKLGFEEIKKEDVPEEIRSTSEFAHLCPESAVCMKKKL